ncbi:related to MOT1-transcriptional accessory protein [Sporisorium reilianum SRZ2]|uniref:TATA-binding protein-associated factor mot1 n=1 Tax=Sporisorium reilianum (strain SRZ2) TaxID=999809 RepID=E6ZNI4_SPORE|nr:related to MOT1-transcriptional accessory protein [Sporisorium reilianum SRZ2]
MAATRLDRLVSLLDTGSTLTIRATAAKQLGQIAAVRIRGQSTAQHAAAHPRPPPKADSSTQSNYNIGSGTSTPAIDPEADGLVKSEEASSSSTKQSAKFGTSAQINKQHNFTGPSVDDQLGIYRGTDGDWDEITSYLARVVPFLRSKSWDTRVAAALAIESICHAAGIWDPDIQPSKPGESSKSALTDQDEDAKDEKPDLSELLATESLLTFDAFSLPTVLSTGTKLLSSAGKEFEQASLAAGSDRLAQAKKDVVSKLGLGFGLDEMDIGMDVEAELKTGESTSTSSIPRSSQGSVDWRTAAGGASKSKLPPPRFAAAASPTASSLPPPRFANNGAPPSPSPITPTFASAATAPSPSPAPAASGSETPADDIDMSKLSARERNALKRKRKLEGKTGASEAKTRVIDTSEVASPNAAAGLRVKTPSGAFAQTPATPVNAEAAGDYLSAGPPPAPKHPAGGPGSMPAVTGSVSTPTPIGDVPGSPAAASSPAAGVATPTTYTSSANPFQVRPGEWPFRLVVDTLSVDLFSPTWETRHGAALGLRELLKTQGSGGGKVQLASKQDNAKMHKAWCDDMSIKLLCVFALDRLGDFVFDQVVAPVRETASQTLACLMPHMPESSILSVHSVLLQMIRQDHAAEGAATDFNAGFAAKRGKKGYVWEVRHAGLLGLKYEVVVKKDLLMSSAVVESEPVHVKKEEQDPKPLGEEDAVLDTGKMLRDVVEVAILGLKDDDDDVRAVAASALVPIVDVILQKLPGEVGRLLDQLWDCLGDLKDDLASSTGGIMDLLAKLVEHPGIVIHLRAEAQEQRALSLLIPRLFPFFRHTITSVRLSVLNALRVFLTVPSLPKDWIDERVLRLLFQNLVVEEKLPIRRASADAWAHALAHVAGDSANVQKLLGPYVVNFFRIIMTPLGSPIDFSLFYSASFGTSSHADVNRHNVDKGILTQDLSLVGVNAVIRGRLSAAEALGCAMARFPRAHDEAAFGDVLREYLESTSALQKCLAAAIIQEWAQACAGLGVDLKDSSAVVAGIAGSLISVLETPAPPTYAEMTVMLQRIQAECQGLYNSFQRDAKVAKAKIPALPTTVDPLGMLVDAFTIDTAKDVAQNGFETLLSQAGSKAKKAALPLLEDRRRKLIASIGFYQANKEKQDTQVFASIAGAVISLKMLPPKLNPVIRSVMNSVKFEENVDLQVRSARSVAKLIEYCVSPAAKSNPSDKIVKNLCAFVCQDTTRVAIFAASKDEREGILSMNEPAVVPKGPGRTSTKDEPVESEEVLQGKLIRRGAAAALAQLADLFGEKLFEAVPMLWQCMSSSLLSTFGSTAAEADSLIAKQDDLGQGILDAWAVLDVNLPNLKGSLCDKVVELLPALTLAIQSEFAVIRSAAAKCFAVVASCLTEVALKHVVEQVVPLIGDAASITNRQGAVELVYHTVQQLDLKILPYVIFLIVPVLGRMSDNDEKVRLVATNTFASLVKMVPLEAGLPDPPGFSDDLLQRRETERKFLMQLLDGSKVEPYRIPVKINAKLRKYQQDGVNWMAFLAKYQLHGILCDDMGLGKTLQSICILSSKHHERAERYKLTQAADAKPLPSLIICPPTLTGHWCHEIKQYANNLRPLLYSGLPAERVRLQAEIARYDAVVMSYDVVRNDIAALSQISWNYCILDEGHVIRTAKTKTTKAVKLLRANHRLLLSGTPIQNNVLELWSLFDFLMPGFLGTERSFHERFGKPIIASRDGKLSSKEQEAAALALEALHKQVLPFLLRRLKEDVLDDLPPKIIQDIECDLGDIQKQLYDDFSKEQNEDEAEAFAGSAASAAAAAGGREPSADKQHVFKALQYMRKLVNHPSLVLTDDNPKHVAIKQKLAKGGGSLNDIAHSPKLQALRQLLLDCGIGHGGGSQASGSAGAPSELAGSEENAVSQHRVLIFCQLKQMIDIIQRDLFAALMPSVSYMRLDGSVSAEKRHSIVQTFNADPSIDVLLLTTQVGGLGLTLTGADTVIFVEHDWNPMKDLQAMDRAHRLGQKKVVNVYRLITKNTLEAKIMGLQRFKLNVANSVVNQQNAGMDSMETEQILDLFDSQGGAAAAGNGVDEAGKKKGFGKLTQKQILEGAHRGPENEEHEYGEMSGWRPDA